MVDSRILPTVETGGDMKKLSFMLFVLTLILPAPLNAADEPSTTFGISKSALCYLADPITKYLQGKAYVFLPPGTRLLLYARKDEYGRRLFLSETGIWGYINEDKYYTGAAVTSFSRLPKFVFITTKCSIDLGEDLTGTLTPSETYSLLEETNDEYRIRVDNKKFKHFPNDWFKEVNIPKKVASLIRSFDVVKEEDIDYFTRGLIGDVFEYWKPCLLKDVNETKLGGGISFSGLVKKLGLSLNAEHEKTRVSSYSENEIVNKRYYTRNISKGAYSLTRIEICKGEKKGKVAYHYINSAPSEFIIDEDWAKSYSLITHMRTGEVVVSCYDQYINYYNALLDSQVPNEEIPFIISITAKWEEVSDFHTCKKRQ